MRINWDKVGKTVKHKVCHLPESVRAGMKPTPSMRGTFITDIHDTGGHLVDILIRDATDEADVLDTLRKTSEERTNG
jgi:hypothetical protein